MPRADAEHRSRHRFEAIGAPWEIETPGDLGTDLVSEINILIEAYDVTWSRFRADSLVTRMSETAGAWPLPPEAPALLALYRTLYEATAGAVTPLVARRLESLGYDARYSLTPQRQLAPIPAWDDVMWFDGHTLTTREPVLLDVGAAGKGHLVDLVAGLLRDAGHTEFTVDASGDILHAGPEPIRVALEHPLDPTLAIGVYELGDGALCASAPGRRAWGTGLHHILDGLTGEPATEVAATWAMAPTALVADGLATALFFTDGDTLDETFGFAASGIDYVRMFPTNHVQASRDFRGELFT